MDEERLIRRLNLLLCFYYRKKCGGRKEASDIMGCKKSNITNRNKELKDELGFDLFINSKHKFEVDKPLTQKAKKLYNFIDENFSNVDKIIEEIYEYFIKKDVHIGTHAPFQTSYLVTTGTELERKFKTKIYRCNGNINLLFEREKKGEIDVLLLCHFLQYEEMAPEFDHYDYLINDFKFHLLTSYDWLLYIPKKPEYESLIEISEEGIEFEILSNWKFVLRYHPNYNRSLLDKYFRNIGKKIDVSSEQSSIADMKKIVYEGEGISMFSEGGFEKEENNKYIIKNIQHLFLDEEKDQLGFYINTKKIYPEIVQKVINEMMIREGHDPIFQE